MCSECYMEKIIYFVFVNFFYKNYYYKDFFLLVVTFNVKNKLQYEIKFDHRMVLIKISSTIILVY